LTVEEPKQGRKTLVAVVASWLPSCLAQDVERKHPGLALAKSSRHERGSNTRGRRLLSRPPVRASGGLRGLGLHGGSLAPPTCSGSWWRGTVCCTWSGRSICGRVDLVRKATAGVYSAPILLAAAVYLLAAVR